MSSDPGEDHMRTGHRITVQAATEALADPDALLFDPDLWRVASRSPRGLTAESPQSMRLPPRDF
jgi:hypothetical protein